MIVLAASLSACASMDFEQINAIAEWGTTADSTVSKGYEWRFPLPTLKTYSPIYSIAVADELDALPATSRLREVTADYNALRRAVCAVDDWHQPACLTLRGSHENSEYVDWISRTANVDDGSRAGRAFGSAGAIQGRAD